jgi:hypothetical protein
VFGISLSVTSGKNRETRATNSGADKDSGKRQRATIEAYAKRNGYKIDPAMLVRISLFNISTPRQ